MTKSIADDVISRLRGRQPPTVVMNAVRSSVPTAFLPQVVGGIRRNAMFGRLCFGVQRPRTYADLWRVPVLDAAPLDLELNWAAALVGASADLVSRHSQVAVQLDDAISATDWARAEQLISQDAEASGISVWGLRAKFAVVQRLRGLDGQKALLAEIRNSVDPSGLIAYLAYHFSAINEPTISYPRYASKFVEVIEATEVPPPFAAFLLSEVVPDAVPEQTDLASILRLSAAVSTVDLYEKLLIVLRWIRAIDAGLDLDPSAHWIRPLLRIGDPRLLRILGHSHDIEVGSGHLDTCIRTLESSLSEGNLGASTRTSVARLVSGAFERATGRETAIPNAEAGNELQRQLSIAAVRGPGGREASAALSKLGANFWGSQLASACSIATEYLRSISHQSSWTELRFALLGLHPWETPQALLLLRPSEVQLVEARAREAGCLGAAAVLGELSSNQSRIESPRGFLPADDPTDPNLVGLEPIAREIHRRPSPLHSSLGAAVLAASLLKQSRVLDCVRLLADVISASPESADVLPVRETIDSLDSESMSGGSKTPHLAVLLDVAVRRMAYRRRELRGDACEDFLLASGVPLPSQGVSALEAFSHAIRVYFLRFVCTEDVLDKLPVLKSSSAVAEERLRICGELVRLDPGSKDAYHAEIRQISQRLAIQRKTRQIEESKIYVNLDGVRRVFSANFRETFERFKSQVDAMGGSLLDVESVDVAISELVGGDSASIMRLTIPTNEAGQLFQELMLGLRNEFVSSSEYGLDGYLSVRVRHGALSGQIRRAFDVAHLLVAEGRPPTHQQISEHWRQAFRDREDLAAIVTTRLVRFTGAVNEVVAEVNASWIQIKKESTGAGEFMFMVTVPELAVAARTMVEVDSFDGFIDLGIARLEEKLELSLSRLRSRINDELRPRLMGLLQDLETDVRRELQGDAWRVLNAIREARTSLQTEMDRLGRWFVRAKAGASEPFQIEEAVRIAEECVRRLRPELRVIVDAPELPALWILPALLTPMVDVFFTIFENVARHSGQEPHLQCTVHLRRASPDSLEIEVSNPIAQGVRTDASCQRLVDVHRSLAQGRDLKMISREGGSGFHKLAKLLSHDIGSGGRLEFGFVGDSAFSVRFAVDASEVEDA